MSMTLLRMTRLLPAKVAVPGLFLAGTYLAAIISAATHTSRLNYLQTKRASTERSVYHFNLPPPSVAVTY